MNEVENEKLRESCENLDLEGVKEALANGADPSYTFECIFEGEEEDEYFSQKYCVLEAALVSVNTLHDESSENAENDSQVKFAEGVEIIKQLLQSGANPRGADESSTILCLAIATDCIEIVEMLLEYDPSSINEVNELGYTPLHAICYAGANISDQLLKLLLSKNPALINAKDAKGRTLACYLSQYDDIDENIKAFLTLLIQNHADLSIADENGISPLSIAREREDIRNVISNCGYKLEFPKLEVDDDIHRVLSNAQQYVKDYFTLQPISVLVEDPFHPNAIEYQQHLRTETHGNVERVYYQSRSLVNKECIIRNDFQHLFSTYFCTQMAEYVNFQEDTDLDYIASLFSHLVNDGEVLAQSIQDVQVKDFPASVRSEHFAKEHKQESDLYSNPAEIFNKTYENWHIRSGWMDQRKVTIAGVTYSIVDGDDVNLKDLLKKENTEPTLRLMIKLWVIHQLITQCDMGKIAEHEFFKVHNLEEVLKDLQTKICDKITYNINLSFEERRQLATSNSTNYFSLSSIKYQLAQKLSFLRLLVGHANFDVNQNVDPTLTRGERFRFYLSAHLNISVIRYFFENLKKQYAKTKSLVLKFTQERKDIKSLSKGFFTFLATLYATAWFPFIALYFSLTGITSLPFSLLRKALGVKFGGLGDKALTVFEVAKDFSLLIGGGFYAVSAFTSIGAFLLGTTGLSIGISFGFYVGILATSLLLLACLPEHKMYTFPGWVKDPHGAWVYKEESDYTGILNFINAVSSSTFVAIHAFIAAVALGVYTSVALGGLLMHKVRNFLHPKPSEDALKNCSQNLNHSVRFKNFIAALMSKLKENKCTPEDDEHLAVLSTCQRIVENNREKFDKFLEEKIEDDTVESKNVFRFAQDNMKKTKAFIPSWKLIDRMKQDLADQPSSQLKDGVEQIHEAYHEKLGCYL